MAESQGMSSTYLGSFQCIHMQIQGGERLMEMIFFLCTIRFIRLMSSIRQNLSILTWVHSNGTSRKYQPILNPHRHSNQITMHSAAFKSSPVHPYCPPHVIPRWSNPWNPVCVAPIRSDFLSASVHCSVVCSRPCDCTVEVGSLRTIA
jgi:hypothetical protein